MTLSLLAFAAVALPEPQLIVQLKPGADPAAVAARAKVVLRDVTPNAPFALYGVTSGTADAAQLRLMADTTSVLWAEDNVEAQNPETTASRTSPTYKGSSLSVIGDHDTLVARNTNSLAQVGYSPALAASTGRTVKLAILDSGLSRKQTGLWSKVVASYDVTGGNADDAPAGIDSSRNGIADEAVGHGTMVAGIVDTVAPQVKLVIAKIADSDGRSNGWSIVRGMAFAVTNGAEIANLSLGSVQSIAAFNDVSEWAETKGLLVVAPSGNGGTDRSWYPARSSHALCVGGLNPDDTKACFSNWDSALDSSAPAVGLTSQWWDGGLGKWSGTSFAAPFVAGGLADCLRRTSSRRSPGYLVDVVKSTGRNVDRLNSKYKGKMGTVVNIMSLNRKLTGSP
ncbi:hypothetical protein EON82_15130 [bacterium]|nr:MAG: hypothetical protein EON82_15130 [bacterium]